MSSLCNVNMRGGEYSEELRLLQFPYGKQLVPGIRDTCN